MLRAVYRELLSDGVTGLHYLPGDRLLGEDGDGATDGTHSNDLGYSRMADALAGSWKVHFNEFQVYSY